MTTPVARAGAPIYRPEAGRSVRPADLEPARREAVLGVGPEPRRLPPIVAGILETAGLILLAVVLAFVIKSVLVQAFYIPSGSMIPTLEISDRVLVEKVSLVFREPERGEVVVFRRPGLEEDFSLSSVARSFVEGLGLIQPDEDRDLIKRVIGLPGERVELVDGVVHIDGVPLSEPYARQETRDFAAVTVPDGHLFVLGDNRTNSLDSRFSLGMVPLDNVIGRAFVVLWPPARFDARLDEDYGAVGEGG